MSPFTPKSWGNFQPGGTPLTAASLIDLETRLSDYTDDSPPWIYAAARGAVFTTTGGDPSFDNRAILQDCIDELTASSFGGVLILPKGIGYISNQLVNKNGVVIVGQGKRATTIVATNSALYGTPTTFPSNTPVIRLGSAANEIINDCRVESLVVDCGGIANSTGIYSFRHNEGCGGKHLIVSNFGKYGIHIDNGWICDYEELELYPSTVLGTSLASYFADTLALQGSLRRTTAFGNAAGNGKGVHIRNSVYNLVDIHGESSADGVYGENSILEVQNISGTSNVTNLVHFNGGCSECTVSSLASGQNAIVDDAQGVTIGPSYLAFYAQNVRVAGTQMFSGTSAPGSGTHARGEIVWNNTPSASGFIGWTCVIAGTPGTWKTFGAISA